MRKLKLFTPLLLTALGIALVLAGCGGTASTTAESGTTAQTTATGSSATTAQTTGGDASATSVQTTAGDSQTAAGSTQTTAAGAASQQEAIEAYVAAQKIQIKDLVVSEEKAVSADTTWEVDYAFPAEFEGLGYFFLLHKIDSGWTVLAHTQESGWSAAELETYGAPADIVINPNKE